MMLRKITAHWRLLFVFCAVVLAGCPPFTISVSPSPAFVGAGQTIQFAATVTNIASGTSTFPGGVAWTVNGIPGGNSTIGTIDSSGKFTAPAVAQNKVVTVSAVSKQNRLILGSSRAWIVAPGTISTTNEPQVALYTIAPPSDAKVTIQFGTDTSYGLATWTRETPAGGGPVGIYVAGMRANTQYHMRAVLQFADGSTVNDADHAFTTGAFPTANLPNLVASTAPGMAPHPGVELLSINAGPVVTDLAGRVLWGYGAPSGLVSMGVRLMPNGDFLVNSIKVGGNVPDGTDSVLKELDLGGNLVWSMTAAQLNQALAGATCSGCNITVIGTHHDFAALPNGHIILIAAEERTISGLNGYSTPQTVDGDALIELDQNHKPVWVWSEFDHLDVNRHPVGLPDWTHTNGVVYSPDDGDLILSSRHQSWVFKIDYRDGAGTGNVLWKLGYQGDFTLQGGADPVDWQYGQHDANVISTNSSGVFQMIMFDDGFVRVMDSNGDLCGATGQPPCYSRVPVFQIDEIGKTATLQWAENLSPVYSFWGGSSRGLANGDVEFDDCSLGANSAIYEVTKTATPEIVWQMQITGANTYRGVRMGSLYPGVQW